LKTLRDFWQSYPFEPTPEVTADKEKQANGAMPLADFQKILPDCSWLRHCKDDAANLSEPEWYGMMSIVARCTSAEELAHELSKAHPGYDPRMTLEKMYQAKERSKPLTCAVINDKFHHEACKTCPFGCRTKFKSSPIILGTDTQRLTPNYTEVGNAQRFANSYMERYRWHVERKSWLNYDKGHWGQDSSGKVQLALEESLRALRGEGAKGAEWGYECETAAKLSASERLSRPRMAIQTKDLDLEDHLLCCANGLIDLRTGELLDWDPSKYCSMSSTAEYRRGQRDKSWDMVTASMCYEEQAYQHFLRRCLGYTATGLTQEEKFFIMQGRGGIGKGTMMLSIHRVLGSYSVAAEQSTFIQKERQGIPNDIAMLAGKRLVFTNEIKKGKSLDEALVKQATGRDPITARFLNCEFFTFQPQFKPWFLCNDMPKVRASDSGMWRRIVPLMMADRESKEPDVTLKSKLETPEAQSAILNWIVEGAVDYFQQGLNPPKRVLDSLAKYRRDMDPLDGWMNDCVETNRNEYAPVAAVWDSYNTWCNNNSVSPIRQNTFNEMLEERGMSRVGKRIEGEYTRVWGGMKLK
jgi:putative DNA primase/helicase